MGIQGIWGEVGKGSRVSLAKLAVDKLEETGRPFRIAIDAPIWLFQIKSGKGGSNPALRTLYYRLVRLLGLSVQLLFVFDGLSKPPFKRNRPTLANGCFDVSQARRLIQLFAFPCLTAPGEAEAECALFQRNGIVDAVWSEDVDTLAFGCSRVIRNWSSEGLRAKERTHVDIYESASIKSGASGLDGEGMILVALMSGGDYLPSGIPKCGVKVACQAARAGFGHDLLKIARNDKIGIREWRQRLRHELETNESGFFNSRHKAFEIPESFPNPEILTYYKSPQVSPPERVSEIHTGLIWDRQIDVVGLRNYVAEEFEWKCNHGATKFVRRLAPSLLSHKLWSQKITKGTGESSSPGMYLGFDIAITGRRTRFETDALPELRLSFVPANVVGMGISNEIEDTCRCETSDSGSEYGAASIPYYKAPKGISREAKSRGPSKYDPLDSEKVWILETYVRMGALATLIQWEAQFEHICRAPEKNNREGRALAKSGMKAGALEPYIRISKPGLHTKGSRSDIHEKQLVNISMVSEGSSNSPSLPMIMGRSSRNLSQGKSASKKAKPPASKQTVALSHVEQRRLNQSLPEGSGTQTPVQAFLLNSSASQSLPIGHLLDCNEDNSFLVARIVSQASQSIGESFSSERLYKSSANPSSLESPAGERNDFAESLVTSHKSSTFPSGQKNRRVLIRESLDGTWKLLNDSEDRMIVPQICFHNVEILNLTSTS